MKRPRRKKLDKRSIGWTPWLLNIKAEAYNQSCDEWEKFLPSREEIESMLWTRFPDLQEMVKPIANLIAKRLGVK